MAFTRQRGETFTGLYRGIDGRQKSADSFKTKKAALAAAQRAEAHVIPNAKWNARQPGEDGSLRMNTSSCEVRGTPLDDKRTDARWCSDSCRMRAKRRENRLRSFSGSNSAAPAVRFPESCEADDRFHRLLDAVTGSRAANAQAAEWAAYERRHGTPHPDRVRAQLDRQEPST